jgi:hypothetical protein
MAGVIADPGQLGDHYRDPLQGPPVGIEPIGPGTLQQGLFDPGQLGSRQLWVRAGRTPTAQSIHPALLKAGVPDVGALTRHAEGASDLGLGAALGEQLGRLEPSDLKGSTLLGRVGAAGGRHRRTLTHHQPSRQPNPRNSINQRRFEGRRLRPDDLVICADEKSQLQALGRRHETVAARPGRPARVEFEYRRRGALADLAAWDVHHASLFDRIEPRPGSSRSGGLSSRS